ncbi:MAG: hypothetical protein ACJ71Q_09145 [Terriglobales bacterium]
MFLRDALSLLRGQKIIADSGDGLALGLRDLGSDLLRRQVRQPLKFLLFLAGVGFGNFVVSGLGGLAVLFAVLHPSQLLRASAACFLRLTGELAVRRMAASDVNFRYSSGESHLFPRL